MNCLEKIKTVYSWIHTDVSRKKMVMGTQVPGSILWTKGNRPSVFYHLFSTPGLSHPFIKGLLSAIFKEKYVSCHFFPELKFRHNSFSPLPMSFSDTHEEFPLQSPVFLPPSLKTPLDTCLPGETTPFTVQNLASWVFNFFKSLIRSLLTQHNIYILCSPILSSVN